MKTNFQLMVFLATALLIWGCNNEDENASNSMAGTSMDGETMGGETMGGETMGGEAPDNNDIIPQCEAEFTLRFPSGEETTLDFCTNASMSAKYEFDPDTPPEVRSPTLKFSTVQEDGFDCEVTISEPSACDVGYFPMNGSSGQVNFITLDCSGTPDEYEGEYTAGRGYLFIEELSAGEEVGNFTGEELLTFISGSLDVTSPMGIQITGDFSLTRKVQAEDAEDVDCIAPADAKPVGQFSILTTRSYTFSEEAIDNERNSSGVEIYDCTEEFGIPTYIGWDYISGVSRSGEADYPQCQNCEVTGEFRSNPEDFESTCEWREYSESEGVSLAWGIDFTDENIYFFDYDAEAWVNYFDFMVEAGWECTKEFSVSSASIDCESISERNDMFYLSDRMTRTFSW